VNINSGIYIIKNVKSDKYYVGSAVNLKRRQLYYLSDILKGQRYNVHLKSSYNIYGPEAFEFEVFLYCEKEELLHWEQNIIDLYREIVGWENMYNIAPIAGSPLGTKRSSETRARMSAALKGKKKPPRTAEHSAKIGAGNRGKKCSAEAIEKTAAFNRGRKRSSETIAKLRKPKPPRTAEHCAKISAFNKGRKLSPETRARMSVSQKKRLPRTPETKAKISAALTQWWDEQRERKNR